MTERQTDQSRDTEKGTEKDPNRERTAFDISILSFLPRDFQNCPADGNRLGKNTIKVYLDLRPSRDCEHVNRGGPKGEDGLSLIFVSCVPYFLTFVPFFVSFDPFC